MFFGYSALTGFHLSVYELSMAEGVDNDMNEQQHQDGVPHGQEAFHSPSVHFESTVFDATTPSIEVTVSNAQPDVSQGPKKKSAFQITSVTETRAHSRGDSNGYDVEDLNESDVTEIQIETIEDSTTGNGNGGSRFKVVRIQNKEPYKRGRWLCRDFEQPTTSSTSSTYNADNREVHSTSTASSNFFTSNHLSSDASNAVDQSISNHKNMVEVTFNYKPGQTPSVAPANFESLRKRESDPQVHLASASSKSDSVDVSFLSSNKPLAPSERIDKLAEAVRVTTSR